jgi:hypothetical protein
MRGQSRKNAKDHERARAYQETPDIIGRENEGSIEDQKMSGETTAAPGFPRDIILPHLELFCFSGQVCKFLHTDPNFRRLDFFCQQCAFAKDIAKSRHNIPVSLNALTRAFDFPRSRVQAAIAHRLDEPGQRGTYIGVDEDREHQIFDWIQQNAEKTHQSREENS